jgi:hypothetical protein
MYISQRVWVPAQADSALTLRLRTQDPERPIAGMNRSGIRRARLGGTANDCAKSPLRWETGESMTNLLTDLEEFVSSHRAHGRMIGDATKPAWNGYRLTVACLCGVVFQRGTIEMTASDN